MPALRGAALGRYLSACFLAGEGQPSALAHPVRPLSTLIAQGSMLPPPPPSPPDLEAAAAIINAAKSPVMLIGMFASAPHAAAEVARKRKVHAMPAVTTFQVGSNLGLCGI